MCSVSVNHQPPRPLRAKSRLFEKKLHHTTSSFSHPCFFLSRSQYHTYIQTYKTHKHTYITYDTHSQTYIIYYRKYVSRPRRSPQYPLFFFPEEKKNTILSHDALFLSLLSRPCTTFLYISIYNYLFATPLLLIIVHTHIYTYTPSLNRIFTRFFFIYRTYCLSVRIRVALKSEK